MLFVFSKIPDSMEHGCQIDALIIIDVAVLIFRPIDLIFSEPPRQ